MQTIPSTGNLNREGGGWYDKERHYENFELPPLPTISKSWLANNKILPSSTSIQLNSIQFQSIEVEISLILDFSDQ